MTVATLEGLKARLVDKGVRLDVLDAEATAPGIAQGHINTALKTLQRQHAQTFGADYPFLQSPEAGTAYVNDPRVALLRATEEVYNARDALADPARAERAAASLASAQAHLSIEEHLADGHSFDSWEDHGRALATLRQGAQVEVAQQDIPSR
jgi:hypothetical protein